MSIGFVWQETLAYRENKHMSTKSEVLRYTAVEFILGAVMVLIYYITGNGGLSVVFGALVGCGVCSFNFFILAIFLEMGFNRINIGGGYIIRLILTALAVFWGAAAEYLDFFAVIIPLFFSNIVIFIVNRGVK